MCLVTTVATGCTAVGGSTDKAGGSEAVVLKMAITASNLKYSTPLAYFVHRVNELSNGALRITPIYRWGNFAPNVEQLAVRAVKSDKVDLTSVGTRVFDTLGVNGFEALQAPMLIDSYRVQDAVIRSDITHQMLGGLDHIGVTGLGVYAAPLPKLIAVKRPLLGPEDWRGIVFQAYLSRAGNQAITALGAHPVATLGSLEAGLQNGDIQGFAKSLLADQLNGTAHIAPYVTANVNLWSGIGVLIANPARLSRLTSQQRDWLQQAVDDTTAHSTSMVDNDQPIVTNLCKAGARFANASKADLAALRRAFVPVYASLEKDAQTRQFITRIQALKAASPTDPPLTIPDGCNGSKSKASIAGNPLAGTWRTAKLTESQFVRAFIAAGGPEKTGHSFFSQLGKGAKDFAVIAIKFRHDNFDEYESGDGGPTVLGEALSYKLGAHGTVTLKSGFSDCVGGTIFQYVIRGNTLRLHAVKECTGGNAPFNKTLYGSFPFTKSG